MSHKSGKWKSKRAYMAYDKRIKLGPTVHPEVARRLEGLEYRSASAAAADLLEVCADLLTEQPVFKFFDMPPQGVDMIVKCFSALFVHEHERLAGHLYQSHVQFILRASENFTPDFDAPAQGFMDHVRAYVRRTQVEEIALFFEDKMRSLSFSQEIFLMIYAENFWQKQIEDLDWYVNILEPKEDLANYDEGVINDSDAPHPYGDSIVNVPEKVEAPQAVPLPAGSGRGVRLPYGILLLEIAKGYVYMENPDGGQLKGQMIDHILRDLDGLIPGGLYPRRVFIGCKEYKRLNEVTFANADLLMEVGYDENFTFTNWQENSGGATGWLIRDLYGLHAQDSDKPVRYPYPVPVGDETEVLGRAGASFYLKGNVYGGFQTAIEEVVKRFACIDPDNVLVIYQAVDGGLWRGGSLSGTPLSTAPVRYEDLVEKENIFEEFNFFYGTLEADPQGNAVAMAGVLV